MEHLSQTETVRRAEAPPRVRIQAGARTGPVTTSRRLAEGATGHRRAAPPSTRAMVRLNRGSLLTTDFLACALHVPVSPTGDPQLHVAPSHGTRTEPLHRFRSGSRLVPRAGVTPRAPMAWAPCQVAAPRGAASATGPPGGLASPGPAGARTFTPCCASVTVHSPFRRAWTTRPWEDHPTRDPLPGRAPNIIWRPPTDADARWIVPAAPRPARRLRRLAVESSIEERNVHARPEHRHGHRNSIGTGGRS